MEKKSSIGMKKIAIVGPESTGKTELSKVLAAHYGVNWVPEYARTYLEPRNGFYEEKDLAKIANGQLKSQQGAISTNHDLVFFDTDLLVIKIWAQFKYGRVDPFITDAMEKHQPDLYLLTYHDIPYEEDPLRENPNDRAALFEYYEREVKSSNVPYAIIKGSREERSQAAIQAINNIY